MDKVFVAAKRGKDDWVVVHRTDVDKKGNLKEGARPISQNHRERRGAVREMEKLEEKFGVASC